MGDVLTFTPRPKPTAPQDPEPLPDDDLRAQIEAAAEVAVDAAERLVAILDRMDDGEATSVPAWSESHVVKIVPLRAEVREREARDAAARDASTTKGADHTAPIVIPFPPLRWGGRGNLIAAAGIALFDLVAGEG